MQQGQGRAWVPSWAVLQEEAALQQVGQGAPWTQCWGPRWLA